VSDVIPNRAAYEEKDQMTVDHRPELAVPAGAGRTSTAGRNAKRSVGGATLRMSATGRDAIEQRPTGSEVTP
jgi:hypothetical protein